MIFQRGCQTLGHTGRQVNCPRYGSPFFSGYGFSVLELLIVLAVLTTVTAFVLPALHGPLNRSRLRSAAVDVQSAWSKARSFAIRKGMPMNFRCELSGRHWRVECDADGREGRSRLGAEVRSGPRAEHDNSISRQKFDSSRDGSLVHEGSLPDGIKFSDFRLSGQTGGRSGEADERDYDKRQPMATDPQWSLPLTFRPDGRSHNAQLCIAGEDGLVIHLSIRGLTSGVTFSVPFRQALTEHGAGRRS